MRRRRFLATLGAIVAGAGGATASPAAAADSASRGGDAGRLATLAATSPSFPVSVEAPETVTAGRTVALEAATTNEGRDEATAHLEVAVAGTVVRKDEFRLRPDETHVATVLVPADAPGEITWRADTQHDSVSGTVEVQPAPDESDDEADGASDDASGSGPGGATPDANPETVAGTGVALGAIGALGALARRRWP